MAMDFSSCSITTSGDDFSSVRTRRRDRSPVVSGMSCVSNWDFDYGGEREWGNDRGYCDPVDLLPADPFGMNLSNTFTAIATWVGDCSATSSDYGAGGGDVVSGFECYGYGELPSLFGCQLNFGGMFPVQDSAAQGCGLFSGLEVGECSKSGRVDEACGGENNGTSTGYSRGDADVQDASDTGACSGQHSLLGAHGHRGYVREDEHGEGRSNGEANEGFGDEGSPPMFGDQLSFQDVFDVQDSTQDHRLLSEFEVGECSTSGRVDEACGGGEANSPHEGLLFSLPYLGVRDLLSVERVCKSLCCTVQTDAFLWRCIHIDSPLSERITDDDLVHLTRRAQGSLQCLSLVGCSRITDDGLKQVLEDNPRLKKLSIPRCVRLSIDGLISNLKAVKPPAMPGITQIRLGGLFSVTPENYDELKLLLGVDQLQQSAHKQKFYHRGLYSQDTDDEIALDIEVCPRCQKIKLVYDCPAESCQGDRLEECRACDVCIARCIQCGRCISNCEYEETFCLENLCSGCWQHPVD